MGYKSLYIFRHGEVDLQYDSLGRRLIHPPDAPLGVKGRERIGKIADNLIRKFLILDTIYTSPSRRAEETAQLLGEKICVFPAVTLYALRDVYEVPSREEWVGKPKEEFDAFMNTDNQIPDEETRVRLTEALTTIFSEPLVRNIGIVTHGNTAKIIMFILEHPTETMPTLGELKIRYSLERSECWKLTVNEEGRVLEKERIIPEGKISLDESEATRKGVERE